MSSARIAVWMSILALSHMALAAEPAPSSHPAPPWMDDVDRLVRAEMQREKVPGIAVGIVRGGEVIAAKGYGESNVELRVPVTAQTVFQSGSVGKQFTAVAVMLQVEAGKLALSDLIT